MKVSTSKKLTKQQIRDKERAERRNQFYARAKWTRDVAKMAAADLEQSVHDRYVKYAKRRQKTGRAYQYEDETSTSADSDDVARVCESPEKEKDDQEEDGQLEKTAVEKAKKKFFPQQYTSSESKTYHVLAPDTMEVGNVIDSPTQKGNYMSHKHILLWSQALIFL